MSYVTGNAFSVDDFQQHNACPLALSYVDCVSIDIGESTAYVFAKEVLVPCFVQLLRENLKWRVPLHYRAGPFSAGVHSESADALPRFYAICTDMKAQREATTVPSDDLPVSKRARRVRFADTEAVPTTAEAESADNQSLFAQLDEATSKRRCKRYERTRVQAELNSSGRSVLILSERDAPARVYVMESSFAFQLYSFAYKVAYHKKWPMPPQLEALFDSTWLVWRLPTRRVVHLVDQVRAELLVDRLLAAARWRALYRQLQATADDDDDDAASPTLDNGQRSSNYWAKMFGSSLVFAHDDTSSNGGDALSEFGADSLLASSTNDDAASGDAEPLAPAAAQHQLRPAAQRHMRRRLATETQLNIRLAADSSRSGASYHEFRERLCGPLADKRLGERVARLLSAASQLLAVITYNRFNIHFTQVDLFYMQQLMQLECADWTRNNRAPRPTQIDELIGQLSPACASAVERIAQLRYVFLVNKDRRPQYQQRNSAMVAAALYYSANMYSAADTLVDEVQLGSLLDRYQSMGTERQRYTLATHATATLSADSDQLVDFQRRWALVADERRVTELAEKHGTELRRHVLRVPLNDQQLRATGNVRRVGLLDAERVTPLSVLGSLRNLLPEARDGVDFFVSYTPLSYTPANDERYRRAHAATSIFQSIYVGDAPDQPESAPADTECDDDPDFKLNQTAPPTNGRKRKRGRPSKKKARGRPEKLPEQVEMLAEPAIYVGLRAQLAHELPWRAAVQLVNQRAQSFARVALADRNANRPLAAPLLAQALAESASRHTLCAALNATHALLGGSGVEWHWARCTDQQAQRAARCIVRLTAQVSADATAVTETLLLPLLNRYELKLSAARPRDVSFDNRHVWYAPMHALLTDNMSLPLLVPRDCLPALLVAATLCKNRAVKQAVKQAQATVDEFDDKYARPPKWWPDADGQRSAVDVVADGLLDSSEESDEQSGTGDRRAKFRAARQRGLGNTVESQLCVCGGANIEECERLLDTAIKGQGRCCVCQLDEIEAVKWRRAAVDNVCQWCSRRLHAHKHNFAKLTQWKRRPPQYALSGPVCGQYSELTGLRAVDLVECVLDAMERDHDDNERLGTVLACLCRRQRSWPSLIPLPPNSDLWRMGQRQTSSALYAKSAASSGAEQVATESNKWLGQPLRATYALLEGSERPAQCSFASAAMLLTGLEVLRLADHGEFVDAYVADRLTQLHNVLVPLQSPGDVAAYCQRHAERAFAMPICPPVLAESTALGGVSVQGIASNRALPMHTRLQYLLHNGKTARPLATCMPLLQESMLLNFHWPDDTVTDHISMADLDDDDDDDDDDDRGQEVPAERLWRDLDAQATESSESVAAASSDSSSADVIGAILDDLLA